MERLSSENFKETAMNHYCGRRRFVKAEFEEDLKRFQTVGRAIDKYAKTGSIELRLVLNNIIILHNVFDTFTVDGLFYKTPEIGWVALSTILKFLGFLPEWFIQFRFQGDKELEEELEKL